MKKFSLIFISLMLVFATSSVTLHAQEITIGQIIEMLLNLGVIAPEKAAAARNFITNQKAAPISTGTTLTLRACSGDTPPKNNYTFLGDSNYPSTSTPPSWAYVKADSPGACQYICVNSGVDNGKGCSGPISTSETSSYPFIKVQSPNGGETLEIGKPYTIKWSTDGLPAGDQVNIYLSDSAGNDLTNIRASMPIAVTEYVWQVGDTYPSRIGGNYKISIKSVTKAVSDSSDATFTFSAQKGGYGANAVIGFDSIIKFFEALR